MLPGLHPNRRLKTTYFDVIVGREVTENDHECHIQHRAGPCDRSCPKHTLSCHSSHRYSTPSVTTLHSASTDSSSMAKGENAWHRRMRATAYESLSTDATESRMLLAAVAAWLAEKGVPVRMPQAPRVRYCLLIRPTTDQQGGDRFYTTVVSRFGDVEALADEMINVAHTSGREKPLSLLLATCPITVRWQYQQAFPSRRRRVLQQTCPKLW